MSGVPEAAGKCGGLRGSKVGHRGDKIDKGKQRGEAGDEGERRGKEGKGWGDS